jgi:predicted Zn-dependent peptidase
MLPLKEASLLGVLSGKFVQYVTRPFSYVYNVADGVSGVFNNNASRVLDNGLQATFRQDTDSKFTKVKVHVQAGGDQDPKNKSGVAHFLEHILLNQNSSYQNKVTLELPKRSGRHNGYTGHENTVYEFEVLSSEKNNRFLFDLIRETVFEPKIDPEFVEAEKRVINNEQEMRKDSFRKGIYNKIMEVAFDTQDPYGSVIGDYTDLMNITAEDLDKFHKDFYGASNIKIEVVSPRSFSNLFGKLKESLGSAPRGEQCPPSDLEPVLYKGGHLYNKKDDLHRTSFAMAFCCPETSGEAKLDYTMQILTGYVDNKLKQTLRGNKPFVYEAGASMGHLREQILLFLETSTLPEDNHKVLPAVSGILRDIAENRIDQDIFKAAVGTVRRNHYTVRELQTKNASIAMNPLSKKIENLGSDIRLFRAKPDAMSRLVREHILKKQPTLYIEGDVSKVQSYEEFKTMLGISNFSREKSLKTPVNPDFD